MIKGHIWPQVNIFTTMLMRQKSTREQASEDMNEFDKGRICWLDVLVRASPELQLLMGGPSL